MAKLEVVNITKTYEYYSRKVAALDQISLSVNAGEIVSILGLNGAGKTTLVKILAGLIDPDAGYVALDGITDRTGRAYRRRIGAVFEGNRNIYWRLTSYENLEYFGVLRGLSYRHARVRAKEMLELFRLQDKSATIAAHLSRGMQQRLAIGIAMVHHPELLVLDEPTLGVDLENVMQLVDSLRSLGRAGITLVITSHHLEIMKLLADRIALIVAGRLAALESTQEFMASPVERVYTLQLADDPNGLRVQQLSALGIYINNREIHFAADLLYLVLDVVRPMPIASLKVHEEDLTTVFLRRVRSYDYV